MRARILAIFLILLLGLGGVAAKLFSIQIQHGDRLTERATKQYHRLVPLVSRRGTISDRAGRCYGRCSSSPPPRLATNFEVSSN